MLLSHPVSPVGKILQDTPKALHNGIVSNNVPLLSHVQPYTPLWASEEPIGIPGWRYMGLQEAGQLEVGDCNPKLDYRGNDGELD